LSGSDATLFFPSPRLCALDTEGQEFPNDDAAREEARAVARDLSRNKAVATEERLMVTNEAGQVIREEPLFRR